MPEGNDTSEPEAKIAEALRRMKAFDVPAGDAEPRGAPPEDADRSEDADEFTGLSARLRKTDDAFAALEAAVRKSRGDFVARLGEYRTTLERVDLETDAGKSDAALEEAMRIAHRIAGVGKTFGFNELGDVAREAENAIAALRSQSGSFELRATSASRIAKLTAAIAGICGDRDPCPA